MCVETCTNIICTYTHHGVHRVCCSVLRCITVCCSVLNVLHTRVPIYCSVLQRIAVCCAYSIPVTTFLKTACAESVLQSIAMCCSVLQRVAVCCAYSILMLQYIAVWCSVLQYVACTPYLSPPFRRQHAPSPCAEYCSVLQCVAECCSVLQCVARTPYSCCSILQCVAACCSVLCVLHTCHHLSEDRVRRVRRLVEKVEESVVHSVDEKLVTFLTTSARYSFEYIKWMKSSFWGISSLPVSQVESRVAKNRKYLKSKLCHFK